MATPSNTDQQTREDSASRLPPTAEKDPLGIDQHAPGAKLDAGKSRPELALSGFVLALRSVASRVATGRPDELLACIEAERAAVTAGSASRQTAALANTAALILHTLTGTRCNPLRSLGPLGLPYPAALGEVAKVATYGAEKYTPNGWVRVPAGVQRYTDAM